MSDSIDRVFVKAISTIRTIAELDSLRGEQHRPPAEARLKLYGLYKQATEGDVEGIMVRPVGHTAEDETARRKWDAWKDQQGLSKVEAKRRYISLLIEMMNEHASTSPEARELRSELEYLWDQVKDVSETDSNDSDELMGLHHHHDMPAVPVGHSAPLSHGSNFITSGIATPVETEEAKRWRRDVTWALSTINTELAQIAQSMGRQSFDDRGSMKSGTGRPKFGMYDYPTRSEKQALDDESAVDFKTYITGIWTSLKQFVSSTGYRILKHISTDIAVLLVILYIVRQRRLIKRTSPDQIESSWLAAYAGILLDFLGSSLNRALTLLGVQIVVD
ncbi:hypothetical protein CANCADRAFT_525 [Tortispora caseinolytica NRRL Y-17796]|uniref:ACB domain-containing protein n=1 Tax=Tortispora caseinolytica NRRL Y-17796 TaxID=767744 RepID=A0A1E4TJP5_9ASCO|nr:hypothetical protein CANCADRAFT_525 [Tortispora caseinolytica NRRL Y-17796]